MSEIIIVTMFKKIDPLLNLRHGLFAAALFSICVFLYLRNGTYASSWLLYLGSFLFAALVVRSILLFNKHHGKNASTVTMIFSAQVTIIIGVIASCIISFIIMASMVPGYLHRGPAAVASPDTPVSAIHDKTNGLSFRIFIGATVINFAFGSAASIIFPFSAKKDQTKDSGEPFPLDNKE